MKILGGGGEHLGFVLPDYGYADWKSLLDAAINFMPLLLKASDQCYLKDKLIFSLLSLLVQKALGSNWRLISSSSGLESVKSHGRS